MAEEGIQRRRFPRFPTDLGVTIYQGARAFQARIIQISRGGCLVFPPLDPQDGSEIRLSFHLADHLPPINCKGEIVYSISDRGSGVAFSEISLYNQDLISEHYERSRTPEHAKGV